MDQRSRRVRRWRRGKRISLDTYCLCGLDRSPRNSGYKLLIIPKWRVIFGDWHTQMKGYLRWLIHPNEGLSSVTDTPKWRVIFSDCQTQMKGYLQWLASQSGLAEDYSVYYYFTLQDYQTIVIHSLMLINLDIQSWYPFILWLCFLGVLFVLWW